MAKKIKKIRRLVGWYGGKAKMAKTIVGYIPDHLVYVEPFGGSAAVLFSKPLPETLPASKYVEVVNDTNAQLLNLYTQTKLYPEEFVKTINSLPFSKKIFDYSLDICREKIKASKMQKAVAFYIMINAGFANIAFGGWRRSVSANEANRYMNSIDDIELTLKRLRSVHFECVDWKTCLERWDSPHTFAYIDPPYTDTTQEYGRQYKADNLDYFDREDYQELIDYLDKVFVGSFIMSNYPNEHVTIPSDWIKVEKEQYMCATQTGKTFKSAADRGKTKADFEKNKRTEVLYIRPSKVEPGKDVLKFYDRLDCFKKVEVDNGSSEED